MSNVEEQALAELGWYVSDVHCRRAIGYLSAELGVESPLLLKMWGEALQQTMDVREPSPIGPEPELARKFVLTTIEARITQLEDRDDRIENALTYLSKWMHINITRYGNRENQELERILYGPTKTASTKSP